MARGDLPSRLGGLLALSLGLGLGGCTARAESEAAARASAKAPVKALAGATAAAGAEERAAPVTLAFVGDITLASTAGQAVARRFYGLPTPAREDGFPFAALAPRLRAADLLVGNLECVVSPLGAPAIEALPLRCPAVVLDALGRAGFDVLVVANNHALDYGREAFADTLKQIASRGLAHLGSEAMNAQPQRALRKNLGGLRVGLLAYYHPPAAPYLDVERARAEVDLLVVYNHWGREGQPEPMPQQRELGHALIDAGVDLVVGTHAHVVQPVERYGRGLLAYGLGNFVFDAMPLRAGADTGALLEVQVDRGGLRAYRVLTTRMRADHSVELVGEPGWEDGGGG